jgi:inhibitor of cysteine peptidase
MHFIPDHTSEPKDARLTIRPRHGGAFALWLVCLMLLHLGFAATEIVAQSSPSGPNVTISEQDNGKSVQVNVGQTVVVRLPSNPTTGYQWSAQGNPAPLALVKSDYATDPQVAGRAGAGGMQTLQFAAKSSGKVELTLGYSRPWEKDVPSAKTFKVTVVVK